MLFSGLKITAVDKLNFTTKDIIYYFSGFLIPSSKYSDYDMIGQLGSMNFNFQNNMDLKSLVDLEQVSEPSLPQHDSSRGRRYFTRN